MVQSFIGEGRHKLDGKGRVSVPADFRRVLEACDPNWTEGLNPNLVLVYGSDRRNFFECFSMLSYQDVQKRILKLPRGSKKRKAMQRLYNTQAVPLSVDETGRLVLSAKLKEKLGLTDKVFFAGNGDTFEIWNPDTYDEDMDADLTADDDFDPDADPSIYLDGDDEG